jgi:hypothetical protein
MATTTSVEEVVMSPCTGLVIIQPLNASVSPHYKSFPANTWWNALNKVYTRRRRDFGIPTINLFPAPVSPTSIIFRAHSIAIWNFPIRITNTLQTRFRNISYDNSMYLTEIKFLACCMTEFVSKSDNPGVLYNRSYV